MNRNYNTEQRSLIENFLISNVNKFVSSKEILDYMEQNNCKIGFTTIYRTLNLLEKNKKVRIEVKDNTKYYQYIMTECCNHFHIKCRNCGKMQHLDCEEFEKIKKHIKEEHHFELDVTTIIYGLCEDCLEKVEI